MPGASFIANRRAIAKFSAWWNGKGTKSPSRYRTSDLKNLGEAGQIDKKRKIPWNMALLFRNMTKNWPDQNEIKYNNI